MSYSRIRGNSQIMDFSVDLGRLKKPFLTTSTGNPTDWNITDGAMDALITGIKLLPVNDSDVASKWYVDQQDLLGVEWKVSAQFATSTGITGAVYTSTGGTAGSGAFTNVNFTQYFDKDSHTVLVGDRVLVMHQIDQKQNGLYVVTSTGVTGGLKRAEDQDGQPSSEVSIGNAVYVENGDTYGGTHWVTTKPLGYDGSGVLTLNTDDIVWTQFSGVGTYTAGDGINILGGTISVDVTDIVGTGLIDDGFNNLAVDFAGTGGNYGTASTVARSDHSHTFTYALNDLTDVDVTGAVAGSILIRSSDGNWYDQVMSGDVIISSTGVTTIQDNAVQASDIDWGSGADQVDASSVPLQIGGGETYSGSATNVQDALEELQGLIGGVSVFNEKPTVVHNSTTCTLLHAPTAGTTRVYVNGLRMEDPLDYSVLGTTVTFTFQLKTTPHQSDVVVCDYQF